MGKKKSSGNIYQSEEEVYEDLQRLMQVWEKNGTQNLFSKRSYLNSIKKDYRSLRICQMVFSHPDIFNLEEEIKYIPIDVMREEFLISIIYDNPKLLCSRDERGPRTVVIPEEKQTLPVLVAFELGKRIYEKYSAIQWGQYGEKLPYTGRSLEFRNTITDLADSVEDKIGTNNLKHSQVFQDVNERNAFINKVIALIQEESTMCSLKPDEYYSPKYTHFDYTFNQKMLILISGYADSGKTTFSHYLASTITGTVCFDSDQLLESSLLNEKLSQLVKPNNNVVIFSDLDAFDFFDPQEINEAMGNANILKIYMKPSSVKRMLHNSKYRQRG